MRPGLVVSLRVVASSPGGRFTLLWNAKRISARSRLQFHIGQTIRARVEGENGPLRLRLLAVSGSSPGSSSPGSIAPRAQSLLFASLLRAGSGLPNESEAGRRLALLSRARGRRRLGLSRLYAELLSRGADPTADFLEALESLLFGGRGRPWSSKDREERRRRDWNKVPERNKMAQEWNGENDSDPLLKLLSGVEGPSGQWIFKRLHRFYKGRDTDLILKFRRGPNPALALTVHDGERTLEFLLEGLKEVSLSVFSDNPDSIGDEEWLIFRKRLAVLNVNVNDGISPLSESDGFTVGAVDTVREMEARY